jgi:hypothetical protein
MRSMKLVRTIATCALFLGLGWQAANAQADGNAVLWEPVDIPSRNLFLGPTSEGIIPALEKVTFLGRQSGGTNLKYKIRDANGLR